MRLHYARLAGFPNGFPAHITLCKHTSSTCTLRPTCTLGAWQATRCPAFPLLPKLSRPSQNCKPFPELFQGPWAQAGPPAFPPFTKHARPFKAVLPFLNLPQTLQPQAGMKRGELWKVKGLPNASPGLSRGNSGYPWPPVENCRAIESKFLLFPKSYLHMMVILFSYDGYHSSR